MKLEDVGVKVAKSIYEFFINEDNISMINKLMELGIKTHNQQHENQSETLSGQSFLFTGTLSKLKRSEAESMVEINGGKLLPGVSSKLNYLVTGEDSGSKLEKAKKIPSIKILSEEDFLKMLNV